MILAVEGSSAEVLDIEASARAFIVYNEPLERILLDRSVVELEFREACLEASRLFIRHLSDELADAAVSELVLLSKGLVYQLGQAYAAELRRNLPCNIVATTRAGVESDTAKINVPYARLDANGTILLIGDTVASGSSIIAALEEYQAEHALDAIYLTTFAGTRSGGRKIATYCESNGIACTILYGLAAFGLGENGFDLSFLHQDTITHEVYIERFTAKYGPRAISAAGWDFGTQSMAPEKYKKLSWIEFNLAGIRPELLPEGATRPTSTQDLWREESAYSSQSGSIELD